LKSGKNILICPLEWGLGHAARMLPLAIKLHELNNNVFVAAGEKHLALFRAETKDMTLIDFPGFNPVYSKHLPQYLAMLLQTPLLLFHIVSEHRKLKKIVHEYYIDIVISDNMFGCWNKKIISVYVTHLPRIPLPHPFRFLEQVGILLHRTIIRKYDHCFIPDLPGKLSISGELSHDLALPCNIRYIGILSRFTTGKARKVSEFTFPHNTVILSGPEPQRGILKKKLEEILIDEEIVTVILEGRPEGNTAPVRKGNLIYYDHLNAEKMKDLLEGSKCIISRSGYTTIMDLLSIGRSAILIPTPGQTEQEYLAGYLAEKGWFKTMSQKEIKDLRISDSIKIHFPVEVIKESEILLDEALKEILLFCHKDTKTLSNTKSYQLNTL
jgi:UDP-N-acetylglucosamine transferase subunit ALG13